ncbi:hypothetical protein HanRHA438_Chr11g0498561 [Helianthus annuus]|nr:hypothetical protein HanRHA438_Chr11g0498561 [Helianthus annuus]
MKIWKPRSRRKPSTVSVRTRPPTASAASRRRKGMLSAWRRTAAAKPDRPAPMTMTPVVVGVGLEVGGCGVVRESCARGLSGGLSWW